MAVVLVSSPAALARRDKPAKPGPATAAARSALLGKGVAALAAGDLPEARRALEAAYRQAPQPETLYQLGRLAAAEGRSLAAMDLMRRFLADPTGTADENAAREAEKLSGPVPPQSGSVTVLSEPGALILFDDRVVGALPLAQPILVTPGDHNIVVELRGKRLDATVPVASGRLVEVRFNLVSGAVLLSVRPALLWASQQQGVPAEAQRLLGDAVDQAARDAQRSVLLPEVALLAQPALKDCLPAAPCLRRLAQANQIDFIVAQRLTAKPLPAPVTPSVQRAAPAAPSAPVAPGPVIPGPPPTADWQIELQLHHAEVELPAAVASERCAACTAAQAAKQLRAVLGKLLTSGLARTRGKLTVTAEPKGAEVRIGDAPPQPAPVERVLWTGPYEVKVRAPRHKELSRTVEVASEGAQLDAQLEPELVDTVSPQPSSQQQVADRLPRPRWRLALGGTLVGVGIVSAVLGGIGIAKDGVCVEDERPCPQLFNTRPHGIAGVSVGAVFVIGGATLLGLPGPKRPTSGSTEARRN